MTEQAEAVSLHRVTDGPTSHIAVFHTDQAERITERLRESRIRATALGDRVRFGFHYFNNEDDIAATIRALA